MEGHSTPRPQKMSVEIKETILEGAFLKRRKTRSAPGEDERKKGE